MERHCDNFDDAWVWSLSAERRLGWLPKMDGTAKLPLNLAGVLRDSVKIGSGGFGIFGWEPPWISQQLELLGCAEHVKQGEENDERKQIRWVGP